MVGTTLPTSTQEEKEKYVCETVMVAYLLVHKGALICLVLWKWVYLFSSLIPIINILLYKTRLSFQQRDSASSWGKPEWIAGYANFIL